MYISGTNLGCQEICETAPDLYAFLLRFPFFHFMKFLKKCTLQICKPLTKGEYFCRSLKRAKLSLVPCIFININLHKNQ